jgi:hypothetical protein
MDLNRQVQEHWNTLGITAKDELDVMLRELWSCTEDDDEQDTLLMALVSPAKLDEISQKLETVIIDHTK